MGPQAQVVHQVMPQNGMQNVPRPNQMHSGAPNPQAQAQAQAQAYPALPVTLSRQHLPDREPGAFTPPAASMGYPKMGDSTPTSRAKSPEIIQAHQPHAPHGQGMVISRQGMSAKSPPRMPNPKASLGANSARNTPKPQPRQVVSFAPIRSPSPSRPFGIISFRKSRNHVETCRNICKNP